MSVAKFWPFHDFSFKVVSLPLPAGNDTYAIFPLTRELRDVQGHTAGASS